VVVGIEKSMVAGDIVIAPGFEVNTTIASEKLPLPSDISTINWFEPLNPDSGENTNVVLYVLNESLAHA
jgi:hypothetical protein